MGPTEREQQERERALLTPVAAGAARDAGHPEMANYSGGDATTALMRMLDELSGDAKRTSTSSLSTAGPNSTLGIVLTGTTIDFMIPGGPAHEEEVLEPKDEILEVDGVVVNSTSINQALKGADEIGTMVRLRVRKAEDGRCIDVVLKRLFRVRLRLGVRHYRLQ